VGDRLATAIDPDGDRWLVTLASGQRLPLRVDSDGATAVVDYVMLPAPGVEVPPHTRVMPHAGGTLLFAHRADALKLEMQRFTDAGAIFRSHPELRTPPELMDAVLRAIA
jgi:hypothetical protein